MEESIIKLKDGWIEIAQYEGQKKSAECQRSLEGYQRQHIVVESLKSEENRQKEYMKK